MGFYVSTTTSLETRLVDVEFDTATTSLVNNCIEDAEAEVNKWLSKRYDLSPYQTTTAAVPPMMRSLAVKLAEGYYWQRASRGSKESLSRGNSLEKNALQNLKDLSEFKANLVDTAGSLIVDDPDNSSFRVLNNTSDYRPTFNEGSSAHWRVDRDKIDDSDAGDY